MSGPSRLLGCARCCIRAAHSTSSSRGIIRYASSASTSTRYNVQTPSPSPPSPRKGKAIDSKQKQVGKYSRHQSHALKNLRVALKGEDLEEAWLVWNSICKDGYQDLISTEVNELLISMLLRTESTGGERLELMTLKYFEDRQWPLLIKCLIAQTKAGRFDFVWKVVSKLLVQLQTEPTSTDRRLKPPIPMLSQMITLAAISCSEASPPSMLPLIDLVRSLKPEMIYPSGGKDQRSSIDDVENGSPLTLSRTVKMLQEIYPDPKSAHIPLFYCRHVILAWGLNYNFSTLKEKGNYLARRFDLLFSSNDAQFIPFLLNTALEARQEQNGAWLKMVTGHDIKADWNDVTWSALLSASIHAKNQPLAEQVWDAYSSIKPSTEIPTDRIWNALLDGYASTLQFDSVRSIWQLMHSMGKRPDIHLYTTMMATLFRIHMPGEALLIFEDVKKKASKGEIQWTTPSLSAVLHGLLYNDRGREALQLFSDMRKGKDGMPKPSINSVNVFLRAYGFKGDIQKVVETLQLIPELGVEPDAITFATVLESFSRSKIEGAVEKIWSLMKEMGIREDTETISTIVKALLDGEYGRKKPNFNSALDMLYEMELHGPFPTAITYTNVMTAICRYADVYNELYKSYKIKSNYLQFLQSKDVDGKYEKLKPHLRLTLSLLDHLRRKGMQPTRVTYRTIISGLLSDNPREQEEEGRAASLLRLSIAMNLIEDLSIDQDIGAKTCMLALHRLTAMSNWSDETLAIEIRKHLSNITQRFEKAGLHSVMDRHLLAGY